MAHMPKPYNHKHSSETKPTTKGTHPISCGLLAFFAFPFLSFCKESSYFLKLLSSISFWIFASSCLADSFASFLASASSVKRCCFNLFDSSSISYIHKMELAHL